jgi:hypothetical protein
MLFASGIVDLISKASPAIGAMLGGPTGGLVGNLVSTALGGVSMDDLEGVSDALSKPESLDKLKELELQFKDLQDARAIAGKETGALRYQRLFLVVLAMGALVADIYAIQYVTDKMLNEILIMMLVFLIWDIRQMYKFYFGTSDDMPRFVKLLGRKD